MSEICRQTSFRNRCHEALDLLFGIEVVNRRAYEGIDIALGEIDLCRETIGIRDIDMFLAQASRRIGRRLSRSPERHDAGAPLAEVMHGDAGQIGKRGADVVKALAQGANSVAIGKLQGFGLAAGGTDGIVRVLELLETEIRVVLGLLGVTSYDSLDTTYLHPETAVRPGGMLSGFPFLELDEQGY